MQRPSDHFRLHDGVACFTGILGEWVTLRCPGAIVCDPSRENIRIAFRPVTQFSVPAFPFVS